MFTIDNEKMIANLDAVFKKRFHYLAAPPNGVGPIHEEALRVGTRFDDVQWDKIEIHVSLSTVTLYDDDGVPQLYEFSFELPVSAGTYRDFIHAVELYIAATYAFDLPADSIYISASNSVRSRVIVSQWLDDPFSEGICLAIRLAELMGR